MLFWGLPTSVTKSGGCPHNPQARQFVFAIADASAKQSAPQFLREIFSEDRKIVRGSASLMVLVCHMSLGSDILSSFRRASEQHLSDTLAEYSGYLSVSNCLVPGTDTQGTLEEGTGTTKRAKAHREKRRRNATGPRQKPQQKPRQNRHDTLSQWRGIARYCDTVAAIPPYSAIPFRGQLDVRYPPFPFVTKTLPTDINYFGINYGITVADFTVLGINSGLPLLTSGLGW